MTNTVCPLRPWQECCRFILFSMNGVFLRHYVRPTRPITKPIPNRTHSHSVRVMTNEMSDLKYEKSGKTGPCPQQILCDVFTRHIMFSQDPSTQCQSPGYVLQNMYDTDLHIRSQI